MPHIHSLYLYTEHLHTIPVATPQGHLSKLIMTMNAVLSRSRTFKHICFNSDPTLFGDETLLDLLSLW